MLTSAHSAALAGPAPRSALARPHANAVGQAHLASPRPRCRGFAGCARHDQPARIALALLMTGVPRPQHLRGSAGAPGPSALQIHCACSLPTSRQECAIPLVGCHRALCAGQTSLHPLSGTKLTQHPGWQVLRPVRTRCGICVLVRRRCYQPL